MYEPRVTFATLGFQGQSFEHLSFLAKPYAAHIEVRLGLAYWFLK